MIEPAEMKLALKYTDHSTLEHFSFAFHCERCGAAAFSELYTFNTEEFMTPLIGKARALFWTQQHDAAYARAASEAQLYFNLCPDCGRWVCASCFYVSSDAVTDICIDCNTTHVFRQGEEKGENKC